MIHLTQLEISKLQHLVKVSSYCLTFNWQVAMFKLLESKVADTAFYRK